jgi:hypothetical protein
MSESAVYFRVELPTKDSPGFLKRQRRVMKLAEFWESGRRDPVFLDQLVDFFADYVVEPPTREAALDALWEASENQLEGLMALFRGNAPNPPETSSDASMSGS